MTPRRRDHGSTPFDPGKKSRLGGGGGGGGNPTLTFFPFLQIPGNPSQGYISEKVVVTKEKQCRGKDKLDRFSFVAPRLPFWLLLKLKQVRDREVSVGPLYLQCRPDAN